ncbi:hypothetical protein [Allorhizocola rhizosphaerae]|uniref:hypothetical protein n=1 Tax=Allorhizocola rhizosphaerae TaxID=1872709 RepID=UPI000E3E0BFE|nr:hypothetical protein [Allorhizocola rhizosphaerae]
MTEWKTGEQPGLRDLTQQGFLASYLESAPAPERRRLRTEAYDLLYRLVFTRLTRPIEARRGHTDCMVSVMNLRPDCLDRFHNDMDAVLDDLFRHARKPIHNLEGWVSRRLTAVTIDAHRRRRGERGALQRPRIPMWLAQELRNSKRLMELAVKMLEWVGVETTAGKHDWPVEVWSAQRTEAGADYEDAERAVTRDIALVIAAMRKRPRWYVNRIERPMGHKRAPLAGPRWDSVEPAPDSGQAVLDAHVLDDARRGELAALAVELIAARVAGGEEARSVVVDVLSTVFSGGTGSDNLDRLPGQENDDDERVKTRLADPKTVDDIVAVVLDLLSP